MKISAQTPVALPQANKPAAVAAAPAEASCPEETFTKSEAEMSGGERLLAVGKGAAYGLGISAAVGAGLSILTCGAFVPITILAVPICTAMGAYIGAVNPNFET